MVSIVSTQKVIIEVAGGIVLEIIHDTYDDTYEVFVNNLKKNRRKLAAINASKQDVIEIAENIKKMKEKLNP